jgi:hypothetical protein
MDLLNGPARMVQRWRMHAGLFTQLAALRAESDASVAGAASTLASCADELETWSIAARAVIGNLDTWQRSVQRELEHREVSSGSLEPDEAALIARGVLERLIATDGS